jgi:acetolactate synthase small subunit
MSSHNPSQTPASAERGPQAATVCFSIQAAAEPGVMPRVLELFAKRNLVPERWVSGVHGLAGRGAELMIDLQVAGLTGQDRAYLACCLAQITDVRSVLTSEKAGA